MIKRPFLCVLACVLVAPGAFAQQRTRPDPPPGGRTPTLEDVYNRQARNAREMQSGDRQAWLNSLANQTKLRAKLTEAWQGMGLAPAMAKTIADAYDPQMASRMHHTAMRGKSDQEVAAMLQTALTAKRYLVANQLLIDYQREKLNLAEMTADDDHDVLNGK
jgi:hypothetical protein